MELNTCTTGEDVGNNDFLHASPGADPGFFLGGGALVSRSTSTPINHIFFFLENTSCIRKPQVISGGRGGGGCAPPAPTPNIRPGAPRVAYISKKLFTYPSPKPPLRREVSVIIDLGEGYLGSFPEMYNELSCLSHVPPRACFCWPEKFRSMLE